MVRFPIRAALLISAVSLTSSVNAQAQAGSTVAGRAGLLESGLLDGNDVAQRPGVVDVPSGKGHVILMGNNALWRGYTLGSYSLVFTAILHCDALDAGRKLDPK